ncbi:hypothetical protein ACLMAB_05710 [Brevibacillus laterosporus]
MKKKKSKSKRFKKVNGQLVQFPDYRSYDECLTDCRRVSPPDEDCETLCIPFRRPPRLLLDEECYYRCRGPLIGGSHGYCDHICTRDVPPVGRRYTNRLQPL